MYVSCRSWNTSLLAVNYHLNGCPVSLNHYTYSSTFQGANATIDSNATAFGIRLHKPVTERADVVFSAQTISLDATARISGYNEVTVVDDATALALGARVLLTPMIEFDVTFSSVKTSDYSRSGISTGVVFHPFSEAMVSLLVNNNEESSIYGLYFTYFFPDSLGL